MIVALTGTPGVGKTTLARALARAGHTVVDLKAVIHAHDLIAEVDLAADAVVPDFERLSAHIRSLPRPCGTAHLVLDGHLSHLLFVECALILRCAPSVLETRLAPRGYSTAKVRENLEAEAVDAILIEAVDELGPERVFEIDTTGQTPAAVCADALAILDDDPGARAAHRPGQIDWAEEVLAWY